MLLIMNTPREKMAPETDGVNHFNIYSHGRTELGVFLSHFTRHPMDTAHGRFMSMEGYWYWLRYRDDQIRELSGIQAKKYGQELAKNCINICPTTSSEFREYILNATTEKLITMPPRLRSELAATRLPLIHAYEHQGKYSFQNSMDFIIGHINHLRLEGYLK